ncbi:MAG: hypothetical protein JKY37_06785 [Nannocystaceae bacterium]|nr:hypothetical protein [Nannocystaceae bacterium]
MAGIFGNEINNRSDFQRELELAREQHRNLPDRLLSEPVIVAVGKQLDAIASWTHDGATPSVENRRLVVMGFQLQQEHDATCDASIYAFYKRVSGLNLYVTYWPSDEIAANENNDDWVDDLET